MAHTPREAAFSLLMQLQKNGGYSNLLLENSPLMGEFDARDRAFISALVYGVIERQLALDHRGTVQLQ